MVAKQIQLTKQNQEQILHELGRQTDLIIKNKNCTVSESTKIISMSELKHRINQNKDVLIINVDDTIYETVKWLLTKIKKQRKH